MNVDLAGNSILKNLFSLDGLILIKKIRLIMMLILNLLCHGNFKKSVKT
jgi:hypothetical protein